MPRTGLLPRRLALPRAPGFVAKPPAAGRGGWSRHGLAARARRPRAQAIQAPRLHRAPTSASKALKPVDGAQPAESRDLPAEPRDLPSEPEPPEAPESPQAVAREPAAQARPPWAHELRLGAPEGRPPGSEAPRVPDRSRRAARKRSVGYPAPGSGSGARHPRGPGKASPARVRPRGPPARVGSASAPQQSWRRAPACRRHGRFRQPRPRLESYRLRVSADR